ncbi:hypothetical protein JL720_8676 [Aureococcus anophagefferens]|nr:hypothetical protein JL720_8676 [Aureococcus anophagefferens]
MGDIHPVQPPQVEFENALDRLVYVQTISIRNYCGKARRVRIEGPAARGPFTLVFTPGPSLAPGLELTADVQFVLPEDGSGGDRGVFLDRLLVRRRRRGDRRGATAASELELRNLGPVAGDFKLEVGDAAKPATGDDDAHHHRGGNDLRCEPSAGHLGPDARQARQLQALGAKRKTEEEPEDASRDDESGSPRVDTSAVISLELTAAARRGARLELYAVPACGATRRSRTSTRAMFAASRASGAVLVNNSPQAVPFVISLHADRELAVEAAREAEARRLADAPASEAGSGSPRRVRGRRQPTDEDADGSPEAGGRVRRNVPSRPYGLKVKVGVPVAGGGVSGEPDGKAKPDDTEPKRPEIPALEVAVTAHAAPTDAVHVSPKTLRFGTCEPRSKQKGRQVDDLPQGHPGSTVGKGSVDVSRLGAGLGALSFEPSVWTDAELLAGVADKKVGQFDYWEERDNQMRADKARSDLNKTQYVKYLRERRAVRETAADKAEEARRVACARRNPSDPTGAELAMEPLEEPPLPPLPDAYAEPLWMNKGGRGAATSAAGGKPQFDADRLIAEKFKPRPTTQAEMRHCSTRLNAADLSKITAPHATLISAAALPPELAAGTTPASQVVPGEATAGFDIALHCAKETLGYRCVVQYTINDRHTLKLAITADVVPVELTLGSPELAIEFDAHSLESSVDATIELKNPGNSAVEFFWTHAPPFSVLPEQGVVPPFGSTVVAVTWTPSPVLKNVGKLLVHVPGAKEDLELAVTGKLDDAKCAFGERKLDFQTVSVGMERDLAASVLNTGQCAAVCNVEVSPEHMTVSLAARARTLDGTTLLCHVRGAKSVRLPVTGSAIIPDVRILAAAPAGAPPPRPKGDLFDGDYDDDDLLGDDGAGPDIPTLDFADQFVGFEERRRIVLQNESEIGASRSTSTRPGSHEFDLPLELSELQKRPWAHVRAAALRPMLVLSSTTWALDENGQGAPPPPPPPAGAKGGGQPAPPKSAVFFVSPKEGKLQPGESTTVRVTFVPTSSKEYEERFPLSFATEAEAAAKLAGDAVAEKSKPYLTLLLRGSGAHPRLEVEDGSDDGYVRGPGDVFTMPTVPTGVQSRVLLYVRNRGFEHIQLNYRLPPHVPVKLTVDFPEGRALGVATPRLCVVISFCADAPVSFAAALQLLDSDGNAYTVPIAGAADNCLLSTHAFLAAYKRDYAFHHREGVAPKLVEAALARQLMEEELKEKEQQRLARRRASSNSSTTKKKEADAPRTGGADAPLKSIPEDCVASHGRVAIDAIEALAGRKVPGRLQRVVSNDKELMAQLVAQYQALLLFMVERGALLNAVRPEQLLSKHHYIKFREQQADFVSTRAARDARHATWDGTWAAVSLEAWLAVLLQAVRVFCLARITPKTFASLPGVLIPKPPRAAAGDDHGGSHGSSDPELAGSNVYSVGECVVLKWLGYHAAAGLGNGAGLSKRFDTFGRAFEDPGSLCAVLASNAPSLVESGGALAGFKSMNGASPEDKAAVSDKALHALEALRCDLGGYGGDADEGTALEARAMSRLEGVRALLVALHLYLTMPNFVPKTTIEFNAQLGAPMCKMIELRNAAPREIAYEVVLEGSADFKAVGPEAAPSKDDKPAYVVVESKASAAYTVELAPRFSKPVEGRLTFFALPGSSPGPRPPSMVFTLRSNVESHAPVAVFEHESTAYEAKNIDVVVKSPFLTSGVFEVSLANSTLEEYVPPRASPRATRAAAPRAGAGASPRSARSSAAREAPADWSGHGKGDEFEKAQALLREPFWTSQKTVRLDASGATNLNVQLLSCSPGLYKAELTFLNGDIGEFVVEVLARVHLPKQMDHFKLTVETEDDGQISITKLLRLPPTNPLLERAFAQLGERVPSTTERAAIKHALQAVSRGPPSQPPADDKATKKKPADAASDKAPSEAPGDDDGPSKDEGVAFEVTTDSPFFQCPDELTVLVDVKEDTVIDAPNSLVLSFYPQKAGTYLCAIASQARPGLVHDIRILNVEVVVTMPRIQTVLEFKAPARRKITQDLPLMNASDEDWMLSVNLQGSRVFSGPQKLKVPAGGRASFPLTFAPTWTGVENAKLTLRNARSPDAFEYTLGDGLIGEPRFTLEADEAAGTYELFYTPSSRRATRAPSCREPRTVVEPSVSIPPYGSVDVEIQYVPSEIGVVQESTVVLRHDVLGDWEYVASGAGTTPGLMNEHTPSAIVGEPASYMFSFRNPFGMPLDVDIDLETTDEHAGALSLLMRRSRDVRLAPHVSMSIPLSFDPVVIAEHHAVVKVIGDYRGVPLAWTFPIRGIVNAPLQLRAVRPVDTRLTAVDGELKFDAIFEPLRPFSTSVHLVVKRATGGRWPFEVQLDVDEPDPDDAIEIEANLHTTAKVQFKLVNSNAMDYTPFNAFFSTDSAHTLTVSPAHGLLAPVGTEGTNFDVSFRPVKYGMLQRGRLIIQTEDMMWSYEVHGTHPSFTVPVSQSKVDTPAPGQGPPLAPLLLRARLRHFDTVFSLGWSGGVAVGDCLLAFNLSSSLLQPKICHSSRSGSSERRRRAAAMVTVVEDLDKEGLLEHLAVESEAKELRDWVKDKCARPTGLDARLASAKRLREKGNLAYDRSEWDAAVWLYLAALHHVDYSKKDRVADAVDDTVAGRRRGAAVALLLSNLAAAFAGKDDTYNTIRCANLGLDFANRCKTVDDDKAQLRAKLLYRRGSAKSRAAGTPGAGADCTHAEGLRDLRTAGALGAPGAGFAPDDLPEGVEAVADAAPAAPRSPKRSPKKPPKPAAEGGGGAASPTSPKRERKRSRALSARVVAAFEQLPRLQRELCLRFLLPLPPVVAFSPARKWRESQGSEKPVVNLVAIFALVVARCVDFARKLHRKAHPDAIPAAFRGLDKAKAT